MGAERWLLFKSPKEALRAKDYLAECSTGIEITVTDTTTLADPVERTDSCWLEWPSAKKLSIGYSFGGFSREIAPLVMREICKRFTVKKIGGDSCGWYTDADWLSEDPLSAKAQYPGYSDWVSRAENYTPEWSDYGKILPKEMPFLWELDKQVKALFAKLDKAVG